MMLVAARNGAIGDVKSSGGREMAHEYSQWTRFNIQNRLVFETRHWLVVVRPHQITLGSCIVLLKRRASTLRDLTSSEFRNLQVAMARYELLAQHSFEPTKFNYVISGQVEADFHVHAIPRYDASSSQEFADRQWVDSQWPYFPDFPRSVSPTDDWLLDEVTKRLKSVARRWPGK
jgi:diadenosine tetraphosphate (Ap4A) HIT family hydrolase